MRIVICDDNFEQLALIRNAAQQYISSRQNLKAQFETFDNSLLLLESLNKTGGYDIALLDICMPGTLGTDIAKEIRQRHYKTEIIFLTTSNEYAVEAFSLKAAHYLLKPFTQEQLNEAMDRAVSRLDENKVKNIVVKAEGGGAQMVDINDIRYIESQKHLLTVYTKTGFCTEGRRSLARFMEELEKQSPGQFIMPYKGYLVNQKAIAVIEPEKIVLRGGKCIPIPKRGFRELQNAYFDYMFGKGDAK
ncbi:MAG: response regulator transcription factor [Clostridiales bacterium]|nr:response regulator transcription factor [Clostridiales bacterium]